MGGGAAQFAFIVGGGSALVFIDVHRLHRSSCHTGTALSFPAGTTVRRRGAVERSGLVDFSELVLPVRPVVGYEALHGERIGVLVLPTPMHEGHPMLIAQISDFHVAASNSETDRAYRTADHLARAVAHLNAFPARPDVVLATGDLVDTGRPEEYDRLRSILDHLKTPVYLIPGNHDDRANLLRAFQGHSYLPRNSEFLAYTVEEFPIRLIGLDTTAPGSPWGRLGHRQLEWAEAQLAAAPRRPTMVFMHHPPFSTGIATMDAMGLRDRDALAGLIRRNPQVVRVLCGHVHRPMTAAFAGTVASSCASTAHQVSLDLRPDAPLSVVMEPPSCLLHSWLGDEAGGISHLSAIGSFSSSLGVLHGNHSGAV